MKRLLVGFTLLACCLFWVGEVGATSQFTRKEGMSCAGCHAGFPRLNEFGERYMRAGYKIPDSKSVHDGEKLSLERVSEIFGIRLNGGLPTVVDHPAGCQTPTVPVLT